MIMKTMSSKWFSVTDGNGKFLGRNGYQSPLGWVDAQDASGFASEEKAKAAAAAFGGLVVNAPRWDEASKSYVVPS